MTPIPPATSDAFIASLNSATLASTRQVNIMAQLAEDAAALLAKIAVRDLIRRAEDYPLRRVLVGGHQIVAGVDVQDKRWEVSAWAIGRGCEMWPVDYQLIDGNPADERDWENNLLGGIFTGVSMTPIPPATSDAFIASLNSATLASTRQVNIMAQLVLGFRVAHAISLVRTEVADAAALPAKIAVRDLMINPPSNHPQGPLRKGRGGKIRRW